MCPLQAIKGPVRRSGFEASACQVVTKGLRQRLESDLLRELRGVQATWGVQKYVRHNALAPSFGYSASKTLYRCAVVVAVCYCLQPVSRERRLKHRRLHISHL